MLGNQERWQEDIFVACPLRDLVPDDHILKLVDSVLDLSWLKDEVKDLYSEQMGRPSIDPESAEPSPSTSMSANTPLIPRIWSTTPFSEGTQTPLSLS